MNKMLVALAGASLLATAGSAYSQSIQIGPGGVRIIPPGFEEPGRDGYHHSSGISEDEAVSIAQHNGVRHVDSVDRRHDSFEVSGRDRHQNRIIVTVDRRDGRVLDVERHRS